MEETTRELYKVETHAHTAEVSSCGHIGGAELARMYAEAGYSTLFITDHFYRSFFEKQENMTWTEKLAEYKKGYLAAKAEGEKYGLCVLWAPEMRLDCCPNDYLVYGLPDSFYEAHPEILSLDLPEFSTLVRENGGMLIQAHPTRAPKSGPTPEAVEGFEIRNTNPRHMEKTDFELCERLAAEYGLLQVGGSDAHRPEDVGRGGVAFSTPILTAADYILAVRAESGCILCSI
ncbi:MAG: PHP domain-containing protein [Clostridia bacterium]|nr:PHP domain-containing protein [Clostridia bacterium]